VNNEMYFNSCYVYTEENASSGDDSSFCGFILTILSYILIAVTVPVSLCLCLKVHTVTSPFLHYCEIK